VSPLWLVEVHDDHPDEVHDPAPVVPQRLVVGQVLQVQLTERGKVVENQGLHCPNRGDLFSLTYLSSSVIQVGFLTVFIKRVC
jgi:hypothetical protein